MRDKVDCIILKKSHINRSTKELYKSKLKYTYITSSYCKDISIFMSSSSRIGVDIEDSRRVKRQHLDIFTTADQLFCMIEKWNIRYKDSLICMWTLKEAYIKYRNLDFRHRLRSLNPVNDDSINVLWIFISNIVFCYVTNGEN